MNIPDKDLDNSTALGLSLSVVTVRKDNTFSNIASKLNHLATTFTKKTNK